MISNWLRCSRGALSSFRPPVGQRLRPECVIVFRLDLRNGRSAGEGAAFFCASAALPPRINKRAIFETPETVENDLALLELAHPMAARGVKPFLVRATLQSGDTVGVVSYAHDRLNAPSLQEACQILNSTNRGVVYMTMLL